MAEKLDGEQQRPVTHQTAVTDKTTANPSWQRNGARSRTQSAAVSCQDHGQDDDEVCALVADLIEVKPMLRAEHIGPESSLTADLALDSLDLVALASRIRGRHCDVDLRSWLTDAIQSGVDTVASMAALLAEAKKTPEVPHARQRRT